MNGQDDGTPSEGTKRASKTATVTRRAEIFVPGKPGTKGGYALAGHGGAYQEQVKTAKPKPKESAPGGGVVMVAAKAKPAPSPAPAPAPAPTATPAPAEEAPKPVAKAPPPAPKPKPKAAANPLGKPASAADRGRQMATQAMTSMRDKLREKAAKQGGVLTIQDLDAMDQDFAQQAKALEDGFRKSFEDFARSREKLTWMAARRDAFGRIMTKRFSHLFCGPGGKGLGAGKLSRRIMPGLMLALEMMLGQEAVEGARHEASLVADRIKREAGDAFEWELVYAAPEARKLAIETLMRIVPHFEDAPRRREWLTDLINSHLAPVDDVPDEGELAAKWHLDEDGATRLMGALFAPLAHALGDVNRRKTMVRQFGPERCMMAADLTLIFSAEA